MKFKDFQAPVLFSSTFKALNLREKNSNTFKDFQVCMGTLSITLHEIVLTAIYLHCVTKFVDAGVFLLIIITEVSNVLCRVQAEALNLHERTCFM